MGLRYVFDGSTMGLRYVSDRSQMGLRSDMSVSEGSSISLRWVSDNYNIVRNSDFLYVNTKIGLLETLVRKLSDNTDLKMFYQAESFYL